jgi:hypothetical protein
MRSSSPKVWQVDDYGFGFSGDGPFYSAFVAKLNPESPKGDLDKWMQGEFVTRLRAAILAHQPSLLEENPEQSGFELLVGIKGKLFLCSGFGIDRVARKYCAIGSAARPALGALYATPGLDPRQRLELALEASLEHETEARKPWKFVTV